MTENIFKVAIISTSLAGGGAERSAALQSFMLDKLNLEVHNIIVNNQIDFPYAGKILNLGVQSSTKFSIIKKINKGIVLRKYLNANNINLIIDNRPRNKILREFITDKLYGNRIKWYVVHSYNSATYFPKPAYLSSLLYQKAERVICVSEVIEELVRNKFGLKNTITIQNPYFFTEEDIELEPLSKEKFILFFGRFDEEVKNFSLLVEAFHLSKLYLQGYKLLLMGDGPDIGIINRIVSRFHLKEYVETLPFQPEPFQYVKCAKFTVLSSRYEGFPMSLVESLALGTPVVSVDCKSGPSEIIKNCFNGLLVENDNANALASAMKQMIDDVDLYNFCKKNASKSVEHLSLERISKRWECIISNKYDYNY